MEKRPALGKGLSALIPDAPVVVPVPRAAGAGRRSDRAQRVPAAAAHRRGPARRPGGVDTRQRHRAADRRATRPAAIATRSSPASVAGAPRNGPGSRACRSWCEDVPEGHDVQLLEWALIENLQREDLNPIEEATAYHRLATEFHLSHDEIATRVGKDRSTVANTMRLLKLAAEVRAEVATGALSMGHARALVSLPTDGDQRRIAREVIARGLSVRETESVVKRETAPGRTPATPAARTKDADTRAAEAGAASCPRRAGRDRAPGPRRQRGDRLQLRGRAAAAVRLPDRAAAGRARVAGDPRVATGCSGPACGRCWSPAGSPSPRCSPRRRRRRRALRRRSAQALRRRSAQASGRPTAAISPARSTRRSTEITGANFAALRVAWRAPSPDARLSVTLPGGGEWSGPAVARSSPSSTGRIPKRWRDGAPADPRQLQGHAAHGGRRALPEHADLGRRRARRRDRPHDLDLQPEELRSRAPRR